MRYEIQCSSEVFLEEELDILKEYGRAFSDLCHGRRSPKTDGQKHFVAVMHRECEPQNHYEWLWRKYLDRLEWERDPGNHAAMVPMVVHNDRDDWKRMQAATWGDMMRRARGLDQ